MPTPAKPVSPLALFSQGRLNEALAAGASAVSADAANAKVRWDYCELLCFKGDYERADKHLDLIAAQDEAAGIRVWGFRQMLRAADARRQFFEEGRAPEFLAAPDAELEFRIKAAVHFRADDLPGAQQACTDADKQHHPCAGSAGSEKFADFRDSDDRFGAAIEVLSIAGSYYLVPVSALEWIEFPPLKRAIDQLWRPGKFMVRGKVEQEALFPVLYPGSEKDPDDAVRLGRVTNWKGGLGGVPARGLGRKDFLMGQTPISILELTKISFEAPV